MTVHLVKLCVGVETVADLAERQRRRVAESRAAGEPPFPLHRTRQTPRRAAALLDGGSIYWVIKGVVLVRQRLLELRAATGDGGIARCQLVFDPHLVPTRPQPRRAFQGWRYLDPADAPADLADTDAELADIPTEMRSALTELGLL